MSETQQVVEPTPPNKERTTAPRAPQRRDDAERVDVEGEDDSFFPIEQFYDD